MVPVTRIVRDSSGADDPGEFVTYSGLSESLVDPIIQQFKGSTGIDVQVKHGGTSALTATLLDEGARPSLLLTPLETIRQPDITLAGQVVLAGTPALLHKAGALP